jgi:hypothetical protein
MGALIYTHDERGHGRKPALLNRVHKETVFAGRAENTTGLIAGGSM